MNTRQTGVTLMELMVVMVIIGILTAIAYPSYREQVRRSNRTEAKIALQQRAQAFEKCFTRYMDYTNAACDGAATAANTPDGNYNVTVPAATLTATTFVILATPLGGQLSDAKCMNFTINEAGTRGRTGTAPIENCW